MKNGHSELPEDRWMDLIQQVWSLIAYWQLLNLYKESNLRGNFFSMTGRALRNELLMKIAHTVALFEELSKNYDLGDPALHTLDALQTLYKQGDTADRSALTFDDCGVKVYRDKVLAHPLNPIKATLGKDQYRVSLQWDTIAQTIEMIKTLCDEVERHNAQWGMTTHKGDVVGVESAFQDVAFALRDADRYEELMHAVALKGKATVFVDHKENKLILAD